MLAFGSQIGELRPPILRFSTPPVQRATYTSSIISLFEVLRPHQAAVDDCQASVIALGCLSWILDVPDTYRTNRDSEVEAI